MRYRAWLVLGLLLLGSPLSTASAGPGGGPVPPALRQRIQGQGSGRVLVQLRLPAGVHTPEGHIATFADVSRQRAEIATLGSRVLSRLRGKTHRLLRQYRTVPVLAVDVGPDALAELEASGVEVESVSEDRLRRISLADSVPLVSADQAWANGFDGTGTVIAVLDTGVDRNHPFLAGKVVSEACYSTIIQGRSRSVCPNKKEEQLGAGAARPCTLANCWHGTHVAGIAAGDGAGAGVAFSGVAKGADLIAVQVFSRLTSQTDCGLVTPCLGAWDSDIIAGLERVYELRTSYAIAAVNLSLGGGSFTAPCDTEPYKPMIDNLRSVGIAAVIASGNSGYVDALAAPACISSAVSVGSTGQSDEVSLFSNVAPFLSLHAPGEFVTSSVTGGGYLPADGTSMAAPHVAGAWAVLRQAAPGASVDEILAALVSTGVPITDDRLGTGVVTPRIRVFEALATLATDPLIGQVVPPRGGQGETLDVTIHGANFETGATVSLGGAGVTVSAVNVTSATEIVATLSIALTATLGPRSVTVVNPQGASVTVAGRFTVTLPPPRATVAYLGKIQDRVGPSETGLSPDGGLDGVVTVTVTGGARTVRQIELVGTGASASRWDTIPNNYQWILGVAAGLGSPLLNAPDGTVNFTVTDGGSFVVFGTDWYNGKFVPGTVLTLTVAFTDDTTATAGVTVPVVPTVTGVTPGQGAQGTAPTVTVSGTNFQSGATVSVGAGVAVSGVTVASATQLQATLTIAVDATVGPRDVQVANPGGGTATLTGGFTVTAAGTPPPPPPGVALVYHGKIRDRVGASETGLTPDGGLDGTLTATVTGGTRTIKRLELAGTGASSSRWDTIPNNYQWILGAAVGLDAGLLNAADGTVNFTVTDGGSFVVFGTDWYNGKFVPGTVLTLTVTFTDDTTAAVSVTVPAVPTVTGVIPGQAAQGTAPVVTVSGTNFQSGATVSVGAGVAVSGVTVSSATQLQATLTIAVDATVGPRDVQVTNPGGGTATLTGGFTVTAAGTPPPPPPGVALVYQGKIRDRVGASETGLTPDGGLDGTLTATVTGGARTIKRLELAGTGASSSRWDTIPNNYQWILGAALGVDAGLLNAADGTVSFAVANGGSFVVFGTDWYNGKFVPGTVLTLTVTFTDDTTAVASTSIGP